MKIIIKLAALFFVFFLFEANLTFAQLILDGPESFATKPASGQSKVLMYRGNKGYFAIFSPAKLSLNGVEFASLKRNEHTVFCVAPGNYVLGTHLEDAWIYTAKNRHETTVTFEGGKTYLFKIQDEERTSQSNAILVDKTIVEHQITTSKKINASTVASNTTHIVPCAVFTAPITTSNNNKVSARELNLNTDVLFALHLSDKNDLLPLGKEKLDVLADDLHKVDVIEIRVVSYSDRLGEKNYNQKSSLKRAEIIKSYLVGKGIPSNVIFTEGRGDLDPIVECSVGNRSLLEECLQPNRRIIVKISSKPKK